MEVKKNLTINLTEYDVKSIIVGYLEKSGYKVSADDVKLLVNKKWTEDYDERYQNEILYFEGCSVNCNLKG